MPKLPCTPRSLMSAFTYIDVAIDTPPAPVWNEKPSRSSPEAAITFAAVDAICRPTGSVVGRVLPDSAANADLAPFFERHVTTPHSVVTAHLIDEAGQPTIAARDEILAFFRHRLK